jgi:hypothetical protein
MLESRRHQLADAIAEQIKEEDDPETLDDLRKQHADIIMGKPMGGIIANGIKTIQKRQKDNKALQGALDQIQPKPSLTPAPPGPTGPGQVPGTPAMIPPATSDLAAPHMGGFMDALLGSQGGQGNPVALQNAAQVPTNVIAGGNQSSAPGPASKTGSSPVPSPVPRPSPSVSGAPTIANLNAGVGGPATVPQQAPIPAIPPVQPTLSMEEQADADLANLDSDPRMRTPAGRRNLKAQRDAIVARKEQFRYEAGLRNMDMNERKKTLARMQTLPEWEALPDTMKIGYEAWASTHSAPLPQMASGMMQPKNLGMVDLRNVPEAERVDEAGNPIDLNISPIAHKHRAYDGSVFYSSAPAPVQLFTGEDGKAAYRVKGVGSIPAISGLSSDLTKKPTGVNKYGQQIIQSAADIKAGVAPLVGSGTAPSMMTSTSTVSTPGSLPTTTVKTHGSGVGSVAGSGSGSAGRVTPGTPESIPDVKEQPKRIWAADVKDIMDGSQTINTIDKKNRGEVNQYMNRNGLSKPVVLSASAQKDVAQIDPVLSQINDLLDQVKKRNPESFLKNYQLYKQGFKTPDNALFTSTSFESLRSAAAALKGNNSRAYAIIQRALDHTPNFDRMYGLNPDDTETVQDKLQTIKKIIRDTRAAIVQDQRKSGVISPVPSVGGSGDSATVEVERGPDGKLRIRK